jgi:hypothetical protein
LLHVQGDSRVVPRRIMGRLSSVLKNDMHNSSFSFISRPVSMGDRSAALSYLDFGGNRQETMPNKDDGA